ncbi:uncharacterized protein LOC122313428 isoform X2 [Carya illinoinensis]|uniref:Uncharacterized protein n=1 Tax=Carya illinoinensis TaxID=32201 RepID=A0A8T1Q5Z3_CARIL|nr:uncharacterized protein LOC122313428 isoform X2 [Carya illinoinensis]KAG6649937.1 hypothetical protein CIPAW_06G008600 [Carya illinoinensis]
MPVTKSNMGMQSSSSGGKIDLKGLYSGLIGNLAGVLLFSKSSSSMHVLLGGRQMGSIEKGLSLIFFSYLCICSTSSPLQKVLLSLGIGPYGCSDLMQKIRRVIDQWGRTTIQAWAE